MNIGGMPIKGVNVDELLRRYKLDDIVGAKMPAYDHPNPAVANREYVALIKDSMRLGLINYSDAKFLLEPLVDRINSRAAKIANKYNQRAKKVSVAGLLR